MAGHPRDAARGPRSPRLDRPWTAFSSPAAPASSAPTSCTTSSTHTDADVTVLDKLTYAASRGVARRAARRTGSTLVVGDVADAALVDPLVADARRGRALRRRVAQRQLARRPEPVHPDQPGRHLHAPRGGPHGTTSAHHVSTDEVYGDLELDDPKRFTEDTPYNPCSPYSAAKAGSDHLVRAWVRSFGVRATISNCSNNYGPWQHVEKFIPRQITNVIDGVPAQALRRRARTCATGSTPTTTPRAVLDDPRQGPDRRDLPDRRRRRAATTSRSSG